MPFLDASTEALTPRIKGIDPHAYVPPELTMTPDIADTARSYFNYENTVGSFARHMGDRWSVYYAQRSGWTPLEDDNYEPFDDGDVVSMVQERPELAQAFAYSKSRFESELIRQRVAKEDEAKEMMSGAGLGTSLAVSLAVGAIDPVSWLPVGTWARALRSGRGVRGLLEGGAAGAVSGAAAEAVLYPTQLTRTPEEGLFNIASSTILSGLLGGGIGLVPREARGPMAAALGKEVREAFDAYHNSGEGLQGGGGSGGAAMTRATTLADETRVPSVGVGPVRAERAGELPIVGNPMGHLSNSPSVLVRRVARDLTETPYHYQGERRGFAAPQAVETKAKMHQGPLAYALGKVDDAFALYRFGGRVIAPQLRAGVQDIVRRDPNKLTYEQFKQRVGTAMRRDDEDPIPEVAAAAKAAREHIDRLKDLAIEQDLLPPDVSPKTAASYLTRVYRQEQIAAQRPRFEGIVAEWLDGAREAARSKSEQVDAWSKILERAKVNVDRIDGELAKQGDFDIPGMRAKGRAGRKEAAVLRRETEVRGKRVEQLKRRLAAAQTRKFKPTDRLPKDHELALLLDDVRNLKEPERLIERVRKSGGLRDTDGLLAARGFKPVKIRNGKPTKGRDWQLEIIDPDARPIDARGLDQYGREVAAEEGFLPRVLDNEGRIEDPHIDDLVEALERDAHGSPVYAEHGASADEIARWREAEATRAEFDRQKIDPTWSNERIAAELGLIDDYVPDTPGVRERVRQAGFYERRVADDLAGEEKALQAATKRFGEVEAESLDTLGRADRMRARIDQMKRERNASRRAVERYSRLVESERDLQIMTDADLRDVARQITDKVLGHEDAGAIGRDQSVNRRGALLERSLTIPDHKIEEFLDSDVERVLRIYTRQVGADVELSRVFGRSDMLDQIDEIQQQYAKVREGVTDEKALRKLDKRMAEDIDDLAAIRDRIRGTYGVPKDPNSMLVRSFRVVRGLNYLRLMGGATLASLADPGAVVMTHGLGRVFGRTGARAFTSALRDVGSGLLKGGTGSRGGAGDEVRRAGAALDLVLDTRANNLAEVGDDFGRNSKFERGLQYAQNKFGLANGLSVWTAFWKQFDGVIAQTRILEEVERVAKGTATKAETDHLAWLGIDYDMATRLNMQQRAHATIEPGHRTANTGRWDDREAVEAIRAAMLKDVDSTVVTPGAGDKPKWMGTEWGKVLGQFKSFSLSAMARTTARGLQQGDVATVQGMTMMVALGMLQYYLRTRDEDIDWDNPAVWIKEGIDRSGVTGWLFEALNTQEKILGGFGINSAIGSPSARYASRNAAGAVLGPTLGVGEDALRLFANIGKGESSAADTHRIRKILPLQNLFYVRWLFDQIEEGANETLDIPDRRQKFRRANDY